jgi:predicted metal-dependent hydrolase
MTTTQTRNPARKVPTRRMSFEDSLREVPRHFAGDLISSHVAAALSAVFPEGEEFFVRSVRRYRDQITDPELKRQVAGFIGQEAMHGRQHRAFNDRLAELGYPTRYVDRLVGIGLKTRERLLSNKSNLAVTAALEHFTATLAELVLTSEETREQFGNEAVKNLFVWHALEESEHKAVAFDVYNAIGGSERTRVFTMNVLRYGFILAMVVQVTVSLLLDPGAYRLGELRRSWRRFRRSPVMDKQIWLQLKDYNRPDFHPDDRDTTALIEQWRERLFGADGTLNSLMAGSAA